VHTLMELRESGGREADYRSAGAQSNAKSDGLSRNATDFDSVTRD